MSGRGCEGTRVRRYESAKVREYEGVKGRKGEGLYYRNIIHHTASAGRRTGDT